MIIVDTSKDAVQSKNMEDVLLRDLIIQLEAEGIETFIEGNNIRVENNVYRESANVLYSILGTCPYVETKCRLCKCCDDYCEEDSIECWIQYLKKCCKSS